MKAILIDPYVIDISQPRAMILDPEPVREIDLQFGDEEFAAIKAIKEVLNSTAGVKVVTILDGLRLDGEDDQGRWNTAWLDDEGLWGASHFWKWANCPQPLAGAALILGVDGDGDTIDTTLTVEAVRSKVLVGAANVELNALTGKARLLPVSFARFHDRTERFG